MAQIVMLRKETRLLAFEEGAVLVPTDPFSIDAVRGMAEHEDVKATLTRSRNIKHHRMFFALLNIVFESQNQFPTLEGMLDAIKIGLGHFEEIHGLDGKIYVKPKSISFASMDQKSFEEFYNAAVNLILTRIMPNMKRADLEQRVFEIMGERGPNDKR